MNGKRYREQKMKERIAEFQGENKFDELINLLV